ncbi:hypothetical protein KR018_005466 [Drosophila ironensis]|nr:hypothetical protein KR018_005466 [Drosophila ironensis]
MKRQIEERARRRHHAATSSVMHGPESLSYRRQSVSSHASTMAGCSSSPSSDRLDVGIDAEEPRDVTTPSGGHAFCDERAVMEEFISCYRHFTALWDSTNSEYLSKRRKEPGYQELLKILRRINSESTVQDVKRKINSLRCCYRREIKKVQASHNSYQPRLWWFHLMDFLKPVLNMPSPARVKSDSMDDSLDEDEDILGIEVLGLEAEHDPENEPDTESETLLRPKSELKTADGSGYSSTSLRHNRRGAEKSTSVRMERKVRRRSSPGSDYGESGRKRRKPEDGRRDSSRERVRERLRVRERERDRDSDEESESELIGRRMAAHFRNMRPDQRLFAERIISEVLVYGRMNRLTLEARFHPGK